MGGEGMGCKSETSRDEGKNQVAERVRGYARPCIRRERRLFLRDRSSSSRSGHLVQLERPWTGEAIDAETR